MKRGRADSSLVPVPALLTRDAELRTGGTATGADRIRRFALVFSLALALTVAGRARAQVDPWEFEVYPSATEGRGTLELETDDAVITRGHSLGGEGTAQGTFPSQGMWFNQYEATYGLTDRIEMAAYLMMGAPRDHGYQYAGSAFRLRGRLFDPGVLPVDLGWYTELEFHKTPQFDDARAELELRPIIEKDLGSFSLVANPIFEKVLQGAGEHAGFEFGYAAGAYYRWTRRLSPGVELYGGSGLIDSPDPIPEQQHYLIPVIWGQLPFGIEYNFGAGFGLTRGSDRMLIKLNFELERFVGALFGPSASGWFF